MAKKPKKEPTRSKMVTGYIIYASEIRKEIIKKHPHKDFGEISKIVGVEWKNLTQESKVNYEKRAQEQNSLSKIQFMASAAAAAAQSQHSPQSQQQQQHQQLPAQSPPQQHQQPPPAYQIFSHSQSQLQSSSEPSQQSSTQLSYQLFQYPQQPPMAPYCNDPACCASGRYQPYPYPFSPPDPATTPSSMQQQQQQQQLQQPQQQHQQQQQQSHQPQQPQHQDYQLHQQHMQFQTQSPHNSPPLEHYDLYKRNNIIYRKPSLVRLRPKDASTQTDPIAWADKIEKMSPKKELRFSEKFIEHITSLGSASPDKIIDAAECH